MLKLNAVTPEAMAEAVPSILEGLSEFGFTSVMDLGKPIATEGALQAMVDLDKAGKLPLRLSATYAVLWLRSSPSMKRFMTTSRLNYGVIITSFTF
jgi:predicted amidohydrolase YtcJ